MDDKYDICFENELPWAIGNNNSVISGPLPELMNSFLRSSNISFVMKIATDWMEVLEEKCHVYASLSAFNPPNLVEGRVRFVLPIHYSTIYTISGCNREVHSDYMNIDFNIYVLLGIAITIPVLAFFCFLAEFRQKKDTLHEERIPGFTEFMWMILSLVFYEPSNYCGKSVSYTLLTIIWLFSILIFVTAVGGNLRANTVLYGKAYNTFDDILGDQKIELLLPVDSSAGQDIVDINVSQDDKFLNIRKRISTRKNIHLNFNQVRGKMDDIVRGNAVLMVGENDLPKLNSIPPSYNGLLHLSTTLSGIEKYFCVSTSVPDYILDNLNKWILVFASSHLITPYFKEYSHFFETPCHMERKKNDMSIVFLLIVWLSGNVTAAVSFVAEIIVFRLKSENCYLYILS